jgi:hypothetical protein
MGLFNTGNNPNNSQPSRAFFAHPEPHINIFPLFSRSRQSAPLNPDNPKKASPKIFLTAQQIFS